MVDFSPKKVEIYNNQILAGGYSVVANSNNTASIFVSDVKPNEQKSDGGTAVTDQHDIDQKDPVDNLLEMVNDTSALLDKYPDIANGYLELSSDEQKIDFLAHEWARLNGKTDDIEDAKKAIQDFISKLKTDDAKNVLNELFVRIEACLSTDDDLKSNISNNAEFNLAYLYDSTISVAVNQAMHDYEYPFGDKVPGPLQKIFEPVHNATNTANKLWESLVEENKDNKELSKLFDKMRELRDGGLFDDKGEVINPNLCPNEVEKFYSTIETYLKEHSGKIKPEDIKGIRIGKFETTEGVYYQVDTRSDEAAKSRPQVAYLSEINKELDTYDKLVQDPELYSALCNAKTTEDATEVVLDYLNKNHLLKPDGSTDEDYFNNYINLASDIKNHYPEVAEALYDKLYNDKDINSRFIEQHKAGKFHNVTIPNMQNESLINTECAIQIDEAILSSNKTESIECATKATAQRSDVKKIFPELNEFVANPENGISDKNKEVFANKSVENLADEDLRNWQAGNLRSFNLESFNQGVTVGLHNAEKMYSNSGNTSVGGSSNSGNVGVPSSNINVGVHEVLKTSNPITTSTTIKTTTPVSNTAANSSAVNNQKKSARLADRFIDYYITSNPMQQQKMFERLPKALKKFLVCRLDIVSVYKLIMQGKGVELLSLGLPVSLANKVVDMMSQSTDPYIVRQYRAFIKEHKSVYPEKYNKIVMLEESKNKKLDPESTRVFKA